MALLDELKTILRVRSAAFDEDEILPLVEACKVDMYISGVNAIDEADALTKQAIKLYVKANFGYAEDTEKYRRAYKALRDSMALSAKYGGGTGAIPGNG